MPTGFILRLLTEDLQTFEGNEDLASEPVDQLHIDVVLKQHGPLNQRLTNMTRKF